MNFLHPGLALAAVGAVVLPIVIHLLFRRRRVPVDWAAIELLREAVRRTTRRLRLEHWTVLALRSLAVLAAGLGLAVPFAGDGSSILDESRTWIVVLDDGSTSGAIVGSEAEFDRVRAEVRRAIESAGPRDRVALVLASAPARIALAPTGDRDAFARALDGVEPSEVPADLSGAIALARDTERSLASQAGAPRRATVLVASAFRAGSVEAGGEAAREAAAAMDIVALRPATAAPVDVRIAEIDARPSPMGGVALVRTRLVREGDSLDAGRTEVRALAEGFVPSQPRAVQWEAGQAEASVEFQLAPAAVEGAQRRGPRRSAVEVRLGDDALALGNRAWTVIDVRSEVDVGVVGRRGSLDASDLDRVPASLWASRALSPAVGSGMRVRDIDPSGCDARALLGLDAVVVARPDLLSAESCDALGAFVRDGGVAIVLPAGESAAQAWSSTLFPRLGVAMRVAVESTEPTAPRALAEEQPPSQMLAAIRPELSALVGPIAVTRFAAIEGAAPADAILVFEDGSPFVAMQSPAGPSDDGESRARAGIVVAFASAPELAWSNLPVKPLMVPLFQELVRSALQMSAAGERIRVGERIAMRGATTLRGDSGTVLALAADGTSEEVVRESGVLRGDDGSVVAVNPRLDRLSLAPMAPEALGPALGVAMRFIEQTPEEGARGEALASEGDASFGAARARGSTSLAFLCLVAALAFLLAEGFLSRIFSHASAARAGADGGAIATVGRVRGRLGGSGGSLARGSSTTGYSDAGSSSTGSSSTGSSTTGSSTTGSFADSASGGRR
jgi:hypothetical protein